jgi:hypothetical protein
VVKKKTLKMISRVLSQFWDIEREEGFLDLKSSQLQARLGKLVQAISVI